MFLQLVRNHFYPAKPFRKKRMHPALPSSVSWELKKFEGPAEDVAVAELEAYLRACPWTFEHSGERLFIGFEMAWSFLLGFLLYLRKPARPPQPGGLDYSELKKILSSFRGYLGELTMSHEYPGVAPSRKYALASTRQGYLYTIFQFDVNMVELLTLVERLVRFVKGRVSTKAN